MKKKYYLVFWEIIQMVFVLMFAMMFIGNILLFGFMFYVAGLGEFKNNIINVIWVFLIFNILFFGMYYADICTMKLEDFMKEF